MATIQRNSMNGMVGCFEIAQECTYSCACHIYPFFLFFIYWASVSKPITVNRIVQINRLKLQNRQLTEEVSQKSERITALELERKSLFRDLVQHQQQQQQLQQQLIRKQGHILCGNEEVIFWDWIEAQWIRENYLERNSHWPCSFGQTYSPSFRQAFHYA